MAKAKTRTRKGSREEKWQSYCGTGVTAKWGHGNLALRQAMGNPNLFAVIHVKGELYSDTPIKVLKEFRADSVEAARAYFNYYIGKLPGKNRPKPQPFRGIGLLFSALH